MTTEPNIGRKLWYWPNHDDKKGQSGMMQRDLKQPFDATVVYVYGTREVNLVVFDHLGKMHFRENVTLRQPEDELPENDGIGFCEWMPYQVKQHEKNKDDK